MTTSLSDAGLTFADGSVQARAVFPVAIRQTVLSGPVDTNGYAAFGGTTGATSVTATGTLRVTAANGFDALGQVDYVGTITNPTWTGLTLSATYLYLDINLDGTCTAGSSNVAPVYRWGGADDVTNGRFTFNIQQMVGKVGNGVSAVQTRRVYVGQTQTTAGQVTSIAWYALLGRYATNWFAIAGNSNYQCPHLIGTPPLQFAAQGATNSAGGNQGEFLRYTSNGPAAGGAWLAQFDATGGTLTTDATPRVAFSTGSYSTATHARVTASRGW